MKGFLRKVILFSAIPAASFISGFILLGYINNRIFKNFRTGNDIQTVFIGDSHIQLGINDKLIPHSINLSQLSEPYKFTYLKLQTIIKNNPAVKKIYLGFSYNSLSANYDDVIDGKLSKDISGMYFFIFPKNEKMNYLQLYPKNIAEYLKIIMTNGLKNLVVKNHRQTFLGHYENGFNSTAANNASMDKRIQNQYFRDSVIAGFSEKNISYLDSIIHLCKNANTQLVLLNMPLHPYYKSWVPSLFKEKYDMFLNERNLKPLDLSEMKLDDSCYVPDGDHLSAKGALLLADHLNKH